MTNAEIKELMGKKVFTQVLSDEELKNLENMSIADLYDKKYITDGSYFPNEDGPEFELPEFKEEDEENPVNPVEENPEVNPVEEEPVVEEPEVTEE